MLINKLKGSAVLASLKNFNIIKRENQRKILKKLRSYYNETYRKEGRSHAIIRYIYYQPAWVERLKKNPKV